MHGYISGLLAGISGCTLPVVAYVLSVKKKSVKEYYIFIAEFFVAQLLLLLIINISVYAVYTLFIEIRPFLLLLASLLTLYMAYILYTGKTFSFPHTGGIYGLVLSPCSLGFVLATSASSVDILSAFVNAVGFSLGIRTPLVVFVFLSELLEKVKKNYSIVEKLSVVVLVILAAYLAYLAGASWRWMP